MEGDLPAASRFSNKDACEEILKELDGSEPIDLTALYEQKVEPMAAAIRALGAELEEKCSRKQAIEALYKFAREGKRVLKDAGFLDTSDDGHGYVVHQVSNYQLKPESVYVPASLIREYGLQRGHEVEILAVAPEEGERCPSALRIVSAMGGDPVELAKITPFEDLIPYYPTERLVLETPDPGNSKKDVSMRAFDLLTPIGFGQRGLIVAPPRTGKTILLQGLANSIQQNWPEAHLIVLLIDERPEEVTDFKRRVKGEVVSSTFDETPTSHVHCAEMVCEKARRMVEQGKDVVILLDSITRLARAYNALASNSGKIMSGGIEATAMQKPKRFFGSARNIEDGGTLTIMGTALVDTGSKMDEVIFEEFKGTGNMEIHLDRELINKRIFPAINFERSGTRKEELLYHPQEMEKVYGLRRVMQGVPGVEAMEMLIKRLKVTKNNIEFLMSLK
ncbi:transcription termination factor Rho [Pelagicoccus albus]|uniref:transcription termination factor Rho n=1 Tax=Pelagicoccus albus TaxID=415222 RepID=UPI003CCD0BEC